MPCVVCRWLQIRKTGAPEVTLDTPTFYPKTPQKAIGMVNVRHTLYPETSYALSKVVGETMAAQFSRWSGIPFVGLRISNIMEPPDYARFASWQDDATLRKWNLWGYVDARDVAQACRLGLTAPVEGADHFIIAAADTCMSRPNADLMAEVFPNVPLREGTGDHDTLLSIDRARQILGYAPQHSWHMVAGDAGK
ncbi:MAG: NAD(P)-dependent oxidoreductase [bacterium]|nr:NAD(P)-dependent oxidoreductase [bacterium]